MRLKIHLFARKTINNKAKEINDKNQKFNSGKERESKIAEIRTRIVDFK